MDTVRDEYQLYWALDASRDWFLADDGTLDVVLVCEHCGAEERFSDYGSALMFVCDEEPCTICGVDAEPVQS